MRTEWGRPGTETTCTCAVRNKESDYMCFVCVLTDSQSLNLNITPNDEGKAWLLTIPDYPHSVNLTLELKTKMGDIVKIWKIKKCKVIFVHAEEGNDLYYYLAGKCTGTLTNHVPKQALCMLIPSDTT